MEPIEREVNMNFINIFRLARPAFLQLERGLIGLKYDTVELKNISSDGK